MLTATAAAAALGLSRRKVYALAAAGELRHYRFGKAVRFDPADLQAFKAASLEVPQLRDEDGSEAWLRLHSAGA